MISFNPPEVSGQIDSIEVATKAFDGRLAGSSPTQVEAGIASFVIEDILAMVAQVALNTIKHVDATAEIAKLAAKDLTETEDAIGEDLAVLRETLG